MSRSWVAAMLAPALNIALTVPAFADATAEQYVDDALPLIYHSCTSVVEEGSGDDAYIDKVVRALVAVSLYNHNVNASMFEISEEQETALHDKFVEALKKGCEKDRDALLAGVIDQAVAQALFGK